MFWKFKHFNLVSKISQKLFKPLPCHKSIGKKLHAICISAVAVSLRWASCGQWVSCYSKLCYQPLFLFRILRLPNSTCWCCHHFLLSSPEPKAQGELLWPVDVRGPSCVIHRLSVINLRKRHLLLNRWMYFEIVLQECSLGEPLPKLPKWFRSAKTKWPPEIKIEKPLNDVSSQANGPISK